MGLFVFYVLLFLYAAWADERNKAAIERLDAIEQEMEQLMKVCLEKDF